MVGTALIGSAILVSMRYYNSFYYYYSLNYILCFHFNGDFFGYLKKFIFFIKCAVQKYAMCQSLKVFSKA